jgi:hypothetical protein
LMSIFLYHKIRKNTGATRILSLGIAQR